MKILSLCLSLPLLLSPLGAQASENVEHSASAILSLRQLSGWSGDRLPQDIVDGVGYTLTALEGYGVWLHEGAGKRWFSFAKAVEAMKAFRDTESSKDEIKAVLASKEQIKAGLLLAVSGEWKRNLKDLLAGQRQEHGGLHEGKVYGAGFLSYHLIKLSIASNVAWESARKAASSAAQHAAMMGAWPSAYQATWAAAYNASWSTARNAAKNAAHDAAQEAARAAVVASLKPKLKVLAARSVEELGLIPYDLAELFTLLWLLENGHGYIKKAFDAAYGEFPEMDVSEVETVIKSKVVAATIEIPELDGNMFIEALWRDLGAVDRNLRAK